MELALIGNYFLAMIAIVNPLGKVPIWVQASEGLEPSVRLRLALLVTGTATLLLALFLLFGREVLSFLGLDVPAFRVGGGVVILIFGIEMLRGSVVDIGTDDGGSGDALEKAKRRFRDVAVPVAVPILAGPGSITTAMLYGFRAEDWLDRGLLAAVLVGVMTLVLGVLLSGHRIQEVVGELALNVQTRIWGLLLTVIAAQMIIVGVGESFPALLTHESPIADDVEQSSNGE